MKHEVLKETDERGRVAVAPGLADIYEIRKFAARLHEIHAKDEAYTHERLVEDVRTALAGEGREADESLVEEAVRAVR